MENSRTLQEVVQDFLRQKYPDKTDREIEEILLKPIKSAARHGNREAEEWLRAHGVTVDGQEVIEFRGRLVDEQRKSVMRNGREVSKRLMLTFDLDDDGPLYRVIVGEPGEGDS